MRKILSEVIKKHSSILSRDYFEIHSLVSSSSSSLDKFVHLSLTKVSNLIINDILSVFPKFDIILNSRYITETSNADYRVILNIADGVHFLKYGMPLFSISCAIERRSIDRERYETELAIIFIPIQNELISSDSDFSLLFNNISLKNLDRNLNQQQESQKLIFSTSNSPFLLDQEVFLCNNSNYGLFMFAAGKYKAFLDLDASSKGISIAPGLFICKRNQKQILFADYKDTSGIARKCAYSKEIDITQVLSFIGKH